MVTYSITSESGLFVGFAVDDDSKSRSAYTKFCSVSLVVTYKYKGDGLAAKIRTLLHIHRWKVCKFFSVVLPGEGFSCNINTKYLKS